MALHDVHVAWRRPPRRTDGVPLVSTTKPTSAEGKIWKVVSAGPLDPFRISYTTPVGTTIGAETVAHAEKQRW